MKKLTVFLVGLAVLTWTSAAMATMFTFDSYTVDFRDHDPGLVLFVNNILSQPASTDLTAGNSYTFPLFEIGTEEGSVSFGEDTKKYDIAVLFDFSLPADLQDSVTGETRGRWTLFGPDKGEVEWDGPTDFYFGDGGHFTLGLSDEEFSTPGSASVEATLNFISDSEVSARNPDPPNDPAPAPVPEPGTLLLLGSGLAGLAFYRRRK